MGVIKAQERDIRTKDATYFDQQTEMVKEINRLKNQLERYSGIALSNAESGRNSEAVPALNGFSSGIGNKMISLNEEKPTSGRAAFEAEATIWRLTEQLAEVEAKYVEREHKLQQTIGRLKLENQALAQRGEDGTERPPAAFVPKGAAHRTYFAGHLSGASASVYRDADHEEGPPPPPSAAAGEPSDAAIPPQDMAVSELQYALSEERRRHDEEVASLRARLKWYADTQVMINDITNERDALRERLRSGDGKLRRSGTAGNSVQSPGDTSFQESAGGRSSAARRNPADIRKIRYMPLRIPLIALFFTTYFRELEKTCEDLRAALQKRFPDSVASLVYATASAGVGADPAELARVQQENQELRQELAQTQVESDRKLRSLRQEYERLRLTFEDRFRDASEQDAISGDLDALRRRPSVSSAALARRAAVSDSGEKPWSSNKLNPAKSLSQALAKIRYYVNRLLLECFGLIVIFREMEVNEARLRTFYTRKIESMQHRHEMQLRALKRSGRSDAPSSYRVEQGAVESVDSEDISGSSSVQDDETIEKRVSLLQRELMVTAEELGKARRTIARLEEEISSKTSAAIGGAAPVGSLPLEIENKLVSQQEQIEKLENQLRSGVRPHAYDKGQSNDLVDKIIEQQKHIVSLEQQLKASSLAGNIDNPSRFQESAKGSLSERMLEEKDSQILALEKKNEALRIKLDELTEAINLEHLALSEAKANSAQTNARYLEKLAEVQAENATLREQIRVFHNDPQTQAYLVVFHCRH